MLQYKSFGSQKQLEKYLSSSNSIQCLTQAKEKIQLEIMSSISNLWSHIEIILEQEELLERTQEAIDQINVELGNKPTVESRIIKDLNTKSREQLE